MSDPAVTTAPLVLPPVLIAARSLVFATAGQKLIDIADLGIRQGRRTVIMGPNGAGKSLLLRLLHGLTRPTAGDVLFAGGPLDPVSRRRQAMVFQRPVLLRRSVAANLRFALRGLDRTTRQARVASALTSAGLTHLAERPARVLSGGEQQRLALARALAAGPEVLFLDEPTASLDPAATAAVEAQIAAAHARGVTIVLVTHDSGQARRLGDDLIFVHAGRIAETGPVARVLGTPQTPPVRAWAEGRLPLDP